MSKNFLIGMDVGSTTVKAVVIDAATDEILWRDYERHDTKQPEKVLEFCQRFEREIEGFYAERSRMFITGSGGNGLTRFVGAKFVQEVNAVSLAVERLYPECGSVIELGGQDA
jgi:activator of 2-hydroxyglutaryl-CoA dehydratase